LAVALILDLTAVAKRMCGSLMCGMAWNLERHREAYDLIRTPKFQLIETKGTSGDVGVKWLALRWTKVLGHPKHLRQSALQASISASRPFRCTGLIR
jgi:hypothetical protein